MVRADDSFNGSNDSGSDGGDENNNNGDSSDLKALNLKPINGDQQLISLLAYLVLTVHCALMVSRANCVRLSLLVFHVHAEQTRCTASRCQDSQSSNQDESDSFVMPKKGESNNDDQMVAGGLEEMSPEPSDSAPLESLQTPQGAAAYPDRVPAEDDELVNKAKALCERKRNFDSPLLNKNVSNTPSRRKRPPDKHNGQESCKPKFTNGMYRSQKVDTLFGLIAEETSHDIISDISLAEMQESGGAEGSANQASEDVSLMELQESIYNDSFANQSGEILPHATIDEHQHESMSIPICTTETDKSKEKKINHGETSSDQNSLPTADIPTSGQMQPAVQDDARNKKMTQTGEPEATENSPRDEDEVSQNDEPDSHISNVDPPPAGNACTSNTSISDNKGRKGLKAESSDAQNSHQV